MNMRYVLPLCFLVDGLLFAVLCLLVS